MEGRAADLRSLGTHLEGYLSSCAACRWYRVCRTAGKLVEPDDDTAVLVCVSSLRRLIYTSRSLLPSRSLDLDEIMEVSIVRNGDCGVTGMLWSDGTRFAQVLEGNADAINDTMIRIRNDPRHCDIVIVLDRNVTTRLFGQWAMKRSDDGAESVESTAFIIGLAAREGSAPFRRLYEIVAGSE